MICSRLFLWFLIYSFMGWIFEVLYNIIITGKWENRGFFYGPVVPIYGVGAVGITVLYAMADGWGYEPQAWHVFIVAFLGSVVLEYSTSWALEKRFHAVWWDYSNLPFNVNGRICLPASTLFGISGVAVINHLSPLMERLTADIPSEIVEGVSMVAVAIFAADFTLTVSALTDFERMVTQMDEELNRYMEDKVDSIYGKAADMGQKVTGIGQKVSGVGQKVTGAGRAVTAGVSQRVNDMGQKVSGVGQKVADMGAKLPDREALLQERMEDMYSSVGYAKMGAVRRVRGFREASGRYGRKTTETMNKALGIVKKGFYGRVIRKITHSGEEE